MPPKPTPKTHLTNDHLRSILNAEAFAESIKTGFAVHVVMHWRRDPAFTPALWSRRLTRFLDKLTRWLRRHRFPVAFAWVNEVGKAYGEHTHIALHLPHPAHIKPMTWGRLLGSLNQFIRTTEHLVDGIDPRGKAWPAVVIEGGDYGMRTHKMRSGVIRYWAKSLSDHDMMNTGFGKESKASLLGIRTKANAAAITNRRYGVSTATIGPKVRQAAGWIELTSLEDLHARLHPRTPPAGV